MPFGLPKSPSTPTPQAVSAHIDRAVTHTIEFSGSKDRVGIVTSTIDLGRTYNPDKRRLGDFCQQITAGCGESPCPSAL